VSEFIHYMTVWAAIGAISFAWMCLRETHCRRKRAAVRVRRGR
jgi:hypothetical protein